MAYPMQPITITTAQTLDKDIHGMTVVNVNHTTGFAITIPASTGDGTVFTLFYIATIGSGSGTIVATGTDVFNGGVSISTDIGGVTMLAASTTDTITLNGTTTGGVVGTWIKLTDASPGKWMLEGFLCSTSTEATPFSGS